MARTKQVNGVKFQLSAEEEAILDARAEKSKLEREVKKAKHDSDKLKKKGLLKKLDISEEDFILLNTEM